MFVYYSYPERFAKIVEGFPEEVRKVWGISTEQLDLNKFLSSFINGKKPSDISVDANANVDGKTSATVLQEVPKPFLKFNNLYLIWKMAKKLWDEDKANHILMMILSGWVYPNDLVLFSYTPYCWNYSAVDLALKGLPFIPRVPSSPAKHADSYMQQAIQLIMFASNHQSGATGIAGLIPIWSMFVKRDNLSEQAIRQQFQWFVYSVNQPVRYSHQSPFVNITIFDRPSMEYLYKNVYIPQIDMKFDIDFAYKVQKICVESLIEDMVRSKNIFTFPILTANISGERFSKDIKFFDEDFIDWICKVNEKFANFNFFFVEGKNSTGFTDFALASCCRLLNKEQTINTTFGAGGEGIGGVGSVVLNLARIGHKSLSQGSLDKYLDILDEVLEVAQDLLLIRREYIKKRIKEGMLPLYNHGFMDLSRQFLIVGINGMYESIVNLLGDGFNIDNYIETASKVLNYIANKNKERAIKIMEEFGEEVKFAIEQVPAEVLASKLAFLDRFYNFNDRYILYSNQWIPLTEEVSLIDRIKCSGNLDKYCTGGAILHLNTNNPIPAKTQKRVLKQVFSQGVSYFAFNYDISKCNNCGEVYSNKIKVCSNCGSSDIDYFYRVVGFITNVKRSWTPERQIEYDLRARYNIERGDNDWL